MIDRALVPNSSRYFMPARSMRKLFILVFFVLILVTSACKTTSGIVDPFEFPTQTPAQGRLEAWFDGAAAVDLEDLELSSPYERFVAGEVAYYKGDVELSYELLAPMIKAFPGHGLNRFVAARLYDLREEVVDFHRRAAADLEGVRYEGELPMTRVYLAMLGHEVRLDAWRRSEADSPFESGAAGFSPYWTASPMMSPWRLIDFETPFVAEEDPVLRSTYLSPQIAVEDGANERLSRPYHSTGTTVAPGLSPAGIYYMETFLHLDEARSFWLYGNFAPASFLWINGEEVFRREENGYGTGRRLRRIELGPGTHRVLVKLANQPRYRDWFDLLFIDDGAGPLIDAPLRFEFIPDADAPSGQVSLATKTFTPDEVEALMVRPGAVEEASSVALYLSAVAAFQLGQPELFEPAWQALMERHGTFSAGHALKSAQVQTLWEVPSELRDSAALSFLRQAYQHDEESLHALLRLAGWLRARGNDQEVRELLERARELALRDATGALEAAVAPDAVGPTVNLKNVGAFADWASYLDGKGWKEPAEQAWRAVIDVAPTHCPAASNLQTLYYQRHYFPALEEISPAHQACPQLGHRFDNEHPDRGEARLALARREAARYPYLAQRQMRYVRLLVAAGRVEEARAVLDDTLGRLPDTLAIWNELANLELREKGRNEAAEILREALARHGNNGWAMWRIATLDGDIPLRTLMPDGLAAAMAEVRRTGLTEAFDDDAADDAAGDDAAADDAAAELDGERPVEDGEAEAEGFGSDEAYYVVDFAGRQYFPDGSQLTLTHTVVRVMTKGGIDRFGETEVPSNARLLLARTIKQDGTTMVPEEVAGKSTLSMPSLAEGDLVEIAYLQYSGRSEVASHIEDLRFFFRMNDISTRHSEYVVLGASELEFMKVNDAPKARPFVYEGIEGVRFVARDNPRPRREPYGVSTFEFLPWIQGFRSGITLPIFEAERRYVADNVLDSLRSSSYLDGQLQEWLERDLGAAPAKPTDADVEKLFYGVSQWFANTNMTAFGTEASHALLGRRGSSVIVLKTAYDRIGIDAEIYLVKAAQQIPEVYPVGEFGKYRRALLRVVLPESGNVLWLEPSGPDAALGVYGSELFGMPASCVSCIEDRPETIPDGVTATRHVEVEGRLSDEGHLLGTATYTFTGSRAVAVRGALRGRTDDANRQKYFEAVLADLFAGATLTGYRVEDEREPSRPLTFQLDFERPGFARPASGGGLQLETNLFREGLATIYTPLSRRTQTLFVGYEREQTYRLRLTLPEGREAVLRSRRGSWEYPSAFGRFARKVGVDGNLLEVESAISLPIQRVGVEDYAPFQKWAQDVEQSGVLFLHLP